MSDFELRPFAWRDVAPITTIYGHYVRNSVVTFDLDPPSEAAMAEKFGHMVDLNHPVLVAERRGEVIGYAYASSYRPRPAYRFTCEDTLYLAPDETGKGIGTALLTRLIAEAQALGFRQMIAVITAGTTGSVRTHEKQGFKLLGTYPQLGYKFDRWLDIVHMQRAL